MNHTERMIAQRPAPGRYDHDLAGELGVVGHWVLTPEYNGAAHRAGYTAYDQCGNGNHGTLTDMDAPTDWGPLGLTFDGTNDYVDYGAALIPISGDMTIALWVSYASAAKIEGIIAQYTGGTAGRFYIAINQSETGLYEANTLHAMAGDTGGLEMSKTGLSIGIWYCIVVVKRNAVAELFLDGVLVDTDVGVGDFESTPTMLGRIVSDVYSFTGTVAQAIIHGRALAAQQIAELYAEPFKLTQRINRSYFWPLPPTRIIPWPLFGRVA